MGKQSVHGRFHRGTFGVWEGGTRDSDAFHWHRTFGKYVSQQARMGIYHGMGWCEVDILRDDAAISGIRKDNETTAEGELPTDQPRNRFLGVRYPHAVG